MARRKSWRQDWGHLLLPGIVPGVLGCICESSRARRVPLLVQQWGGGGSPTKREPRRLLRLWDCVTPAAVPGELGRAGGRLKHGTEGGDWPFCLFHFMFLGNMVKCYWLLTSHLFSIYYVPALRLGTGNTELIKPQSQSLWWSWARNFCNTLMGMLRKKAGEQL